MPTLMAVHAHPDDEGIQTGGVLALCHNRGIKTVLVTCTNGEMGDSPDGLKPESEGHDTVATTELRLRELRKAADILGISDLELLGYRDSGMMGWPQNKEPEAFWNTPLEQAVDRVAELMERHRPEVVITYDDNGLYGHPDHIQAHRAAIGAAEKTGIPQKIYEIAFPKSMMDAYAEMQREAGVEPAPPAEGDQRPMGTPDELITTHIDVSVRVGGQARLGLRPREPDGQLRGLEDGPRAAESGLWHRALRPPLRPHRRPIPETDLFAGIG